MRSERRRHRCALPLIAALLLSSAPAFSVDLSTETVTISNVLPRRSASGAIMDAHDSKLLLKDGLFHWWAASYSNCTEPPGDSGCAAGPGECGFLYNHNVSLYTSPDLVTWSNPVVVFSATQLGVPGAIMYAPKVVYNAATSKYVLWVNWLTWGGSWNNSFYASASSDTPGGTFLLQRQNIATLAFRDVGDLNLFVDDDGTGYVIYTGHISSTFFNTMHVMTVEELTPDFLASVGATRNSGPIGSADVEAPMMFKRQGVYHAVFGTCCCYCKGGTSGLTDYTSASPLGPYRRGAVIGSAVPAQSTDIFAYQDATGATQFMYIGDRWQSSPDKMKAHDFTAWVPLFFDAQGSILPLNYSSQFTVSLL